MCGALREKLTVKTYKDKLHCPVCTLPCPSAPCRCSEPGCNFLDSPPMLRDHLAAAPHSWPMAKIRYGENTKFNLPASLPRRLLVAEEEDGRVFLVSSCAIDPSYRGVSVVCVRASAAAAAAGSKYTCSMWATGHKSAPSGRPEFTTVQNMNVPSCSELGAATAGRLVVSNENLHGGAAMEMRLCVRIEKVRA